MRFNGLELLDNIQERIIHEKSFLHMYGDCRNF